MISKLKKKSFPIYPILIWIYPIIAFGEFNLGQADPYAVIRPLIISIVFGILLYLLNYLWSRSIYQAALVTAIWGILFSSYGHLYMKIEYLTIAGQTIGRHRYLLSIWVILALLAVWLVRKKNFYAERPTNALNLITSVLILMPLIQGGIFLYNQAEYNKSQQTSNETSVTEISPIKSDLPDIYYIVLDSYARKDLLANTYALDNSEFLGFLQEKGFYIATCSHSNYNHTWFSIPSSLNMKYIDQDINGERSTKPLPSAKYNLARSLLEPMGYQMVAFETGYNFIDISDAKYYLHAGQSWDLGSLFTASINAFELMFLRTTVITAALELNGISEDQIELRVKQDLMEFIYNHLPEVPEIDGSKFVYAHISTTHPPFVYSFSEKQRKEEEKSDPSLAELGAQTRLYRESIIITNEKMETIVNDLLEKSKTPPIIIIQGDHGPFIKNDKEHAFDVLNAYYFPDHDYSMLYPEISPVNSFKVLFNKYFQTNFPLIEDRSYFSPNSEAWSFKEIVTTCPINQ